MVMRKTKTLSRPKSTTGQPMVHEKGSAIDKKISAARKKGLLKASAKKSVPTEVRLSRDSGSIKDTQTPACDVPMYGMKRQLNIITDFLKPNEPHRWLHGTIQASDFVSTKDVSDFLKKYLYLDGSSAIYMHGFHPLGPNTIYVKYDFD